MFTRLSFGRKVALIILLSNGILLAAVFVVTGIWNVNTIRSSSINIAKSTVQAFNQDFTKIILFDSPHIAADTVSRLQAIDSIRNVFLYNAASKAVFSYSNVDEPQISPPEVKSPQHFFKDGYLHIYADVTYEGNSHGAVYYRWSTSLLGSALSNFSVSLIVFLAVIAAITLLLSFRLQKIISSPIVELANVVNEVLSSNDLSKRARTDEKNEIGQLYHDFNAMIEDIEKRNQLLEMKNRELEFHRNELELLVEERTREISEYVKELETFSYSVSHDLRSPLRAINGFASMVLDSMKTALDEENTQLLQRIIASSNRMGELIDDILLLSRVNQCQISKEKFNLADLIRDVFEEHGSYVNGNEQINLEVKPEMMLYADSKLMRIVIENLINNAIKYKSENKTLNLKIYNQVVGDSTVISMEDNGIGFDMKYHDKIFSPFQRLHTSDEYEGTCIGLATVKRIMTRQSGDVWAESTIGKGSTFYLKLPVK